MDLPPLYSLSADDFWSQVSPCPITGCWWWCGSDHGRGYGAYRGHYAHRVAYFLVHGIDPGEALVLHTCDNRPCVNPAHLVLGTNLANMHDKMAKGRHLPNGITLAIAHAIREAVGAGESQTSVARRFGVSQPHVSRIVRRERWGIDYRVVRAV